MAPCGSALRVRVCGGFCLATPTALMARLPTTTATIITRTAVARVMVFLYAPPALAVRPIRCADAPRSRRRRHLHGRRPARRRAADQRQGAEHAEGSVRGCAERCRGRAREG